MTVEIPLPFPAFVLVSSDKTKDRLSVAESGSTVAARLALRAPI